MWIRKSRGTRISLQENNLQIHVGQSHITTVCYSKKARDKNKSYIKLPERTHKVQEHSESSENELHIQTVGSKSYAQSQLS